MVGRQFLEGSDAKQFIVFAGGPEGDRRISQSIDRKNVARLWRRGFPRLREMKGEQRLDVAALEVALVKGPTSFAV